MQNSSEEDHGMARCYSPFAREACLTIVAGGLALSISQDSEAAIVYSGVQNLTVSGGQSQNLDMNGGGADLRFMLPASDFYSARALCLVAGGMMGAASVLENILSGNNISGATISYGDLFHGSRAGTNFWGPYQFDDVTPGYIGFKLDWGSGDRYGWVHIENIAANGSSYEITGWAYEDSGAAIDAGQTTDGGSSVPEPSGLVLLACGAAGIYALRKKAGLPVQTL